jgi:hypothetical protein
MRKYKNCDLIKKSIANSFFWSVLAVTFFQPFKLMAQLSGTINTKTIVGGRRVYLLTPTPGSPTSYTLNGNVNNVKFTVVGGGAAGANGTSGTKMGAGGGGGSVNSYNSTGYNLTSSTLLSVTIGSGSSPAVSSSTTNAGTQTVLTIGGSVSFSADGGGGAGNNTGGTSSVGTFTTLTNPPSITTTSRVGGSTFSATGGNRTDPGGAGAGGNGGGGATASPFVGGNGGSSVNGVDNSGPFSAGGAGYGDAGKGTNSGSSLAGSGGDGGLNNLGNATSGKSGAVVISFDGYDLFLSGSWIDDPGVTSNTLPKIIRSGTFTLSQNLNWGTDPVTIESGATLDLSTFTLTCGNLTVNSGGTLNSSTGTLNATYSTSGGTIPATKFNNLTISHTTGSTTLGDTIRVTGTLTITNGGKLNLNGKILTVNAFANTGVLTGSTTSSIVYTGSTNSTMYMDQLTDGTTNALKSLTMYGDAAGTYASILTLGNILNVFGGQNGNLGEVILGTSSSSKLTSNTSFGTGASPISPYLHLHVNGSGVPAIMNLRGGVFEGEALVEQQLESGSRTFRQFGFTIDSLDGVSMNQITDDIDVYAMVKSGSYTSKGTSTNPNGYLEANGTSTKNSAYLYQENVSPRWVPFEFINSTTPHYIPKGRGLMIILRPYGTGASGSYDGQIVDVEGSLNCTADVNVGAYHQTGISTNGFNLIANPYPSYLDYSVFASDNSSTLQNGSQSSVKKYNKLTKNYVDAISYNNGWRNRSNSVIAPNLDPGDAFFIRVQSAGTITFKRSQTTPTRETSIDRTNKLEIDTHSYTAIHIEVKTSTDTTIGDELNVWFADWGIDNNFSKTDVENLTANCLDISVPTMDGIKCSSKTVANSQSILVPIDFTTCNKGDYSFTFSEIQNNKREGEEISLIDNYTSRVHPLKGLKNYNFTVDSDPRSSGDGRFLLAYSSNVLATKASVSNNVLVYPNPTQQSKNITLVLKSGEISKVRVHDVMGNCVKVIDYANDPKTTLCFDSNALSKGIYTLRLETTHGELSSKIIIQ